MKTISLVILLSFVLAACGGGGGTDAAPTKQSTATHAQIPVAIDAQGDSTMYGSDAEYCATAGKWCQTPGNAPAALQNLLQNEFGSVATVDNEAIPGSYLLERLDQTTQPNAYFVETLAVHLSKTTAQIVLMNWCINDSVMETEEQYRQLLSNAVDNVRQAGKTPVLEEPNPVNDGKHPNLANFVIIMRQVAQEKGVLLITQWDAFNAAPNWQSNLLSSDQVHPSNAGYAFKALRESAQIAPLVNSIVNQIS
jgi:acyl-CoA thioesterase I